MSHAPDPGPAPVALAGAGLNRRAEWRTQPERLAAALAAPDTGFVPVWNSLGFLDAAGRSALPRAALGTDLDPACAIFLGERAGRAFFAVPAAGPEPPAGLAAGDFAGLRELVARVPAADAALAAYARAMVLWQQRHRFCGTCGAAARPRDGGFVMACAADDTHRSFPRLDPAVIVLVTRGEECLLGRQSSWPEGRFSTVAGFVEPGETLEDAVAREVHEETNIRIGRCTYQGSQPWPFPAALMLGFHAEATGGELRFNDGELVEARWLTRAAIAAGAVHLPPRVSIAFALIAAWYDLGGGPPLAALGLDSPMFRRPDAPAEFR